MTKTLEVSLGKAGSIVVDIAKLEKSPAVMEYVFNYGLKQMLNDVHASEKDAGAKLGLSQKKLDSLYRGEVAQARASGGDPVKKEMRAMAEADVKNAAKAAGIKLANVPKDKLQAAIDGQMAKNEAKYRKAAEAKLAIKAEAAPAMDLSELLGLDEAPAADEIDH